jgi:orotate phosphoribosyltransferase
MPERTTEPEPAPRLATSPGPRRATSPDGSAAVARALLEAGCVTVRPDAPVTFTSGLRSPVYVDNRRLIFHPGPWRVVVEALVTAVRALAPAVEVVAGVESAGIPHSSAVAYAAGSPTVFVRKAEREHGMGRRIEGGDVAGRHVLLVEDMITTGGSSLSAIEALRAAQARVSTCLAIVTYGFPDALLAFADAGVDLGVLTTFETVLYEAEAMGRIDADAAATARAWLRNPHGWSA